MDTPATDSASGRGADAATMPVPHASARAELERVLASKVFAGAQSHQRLLRYLVENSLAGRLQQLKETVLGIEVFMRPPGRFDPRHDSIVRVEARRLRERLRQHYAASAGSAAAPVDDGRLMIVLPKGSYRPRFVPRPADALHDEAAELVARGQYFLRQGHEQGHRKALQRFEAAARLAPAMAAAHSGVARAWLQLVATNLEPPLPGIAHAHAAVGRALELQTAHAESLVLAAQFEHRFAFDWVAARALFDRALRAAPDSAFVRHAHALSLMMRGDFAAADAELAVARGIDPTHLGLRAHVALLQLYRRQWAAAEATLQALLDMSPDNVLGLSLLAYAALCRGEAASALVQYRQVGALHPGLSIGAAGEAQALAALGDHAAARSALQALSLRWPGRYLSPYQLAMVHTRLGEHGQGLRLLQRAVDERDPNALCLPVDPAFDALQGEVHFQRLRRYVLGERAAAVVGEPAADPAAAPPSIRPVRRRAAAAAAPRP